MMIIKDKIYGDIEIIDELAIELIKTKEMRRIKDVNTNSTYQFLHPKFNTSKFEHCIGVYYLLRKFDAPYEEQIAGLIHDASHFAFAHVIDYVFDDAKNQEKHDHGHENFLSKGDIPKLLKERSLNFSYIIEEENFPMLGNKLPDISADRLDYFLRDSFTFGLCSLDQVKKYLDATMIINNQFVIKDKQAALSLARNFMKMTTDMWATPFQAGSFQMLANAIKIGLTKKILDESDIYETDNIVLKKLEKSNDSEIIKCLDIIKQNKIICGNENDNFMQVHSKARYIDPLFLENDKIKRLSEADKEFAKEIVQFKQKINKGFYIKIIN